MNRTSMLAGLAAASLMLTAGAVIAQSQAPTQNQAQTRAQTQAQTRARMTDGPVSKADFVNARIARLTTLDTDRDGTVSVAERNAARMARSAARATARFERLDADKNGTISRAEFDAAREGRAARPDHGEARQGARRGGRRGSRHAGAHKAGEHQNEARHMGHRMAAGDRGHRTAQPVVISEARTRAEATFDRLDADKDGVIAPSERQAAREASRTAMRERMQARRETRRSHWETVAPASPTAPASE